MGSCISKNNTVGVVDLPPTAKVITLAGSLLEYPYTTFLTAAHVLAAADDGASCILCNSDGLFCDHYITQLDPDELLRPGHLYFILPAAKLRHPLSGGDMKELVVRASSALSLASATVTATRVKKVKVMGTAMLSEVEDGLRCGGDAIDDEVKKVISSEVSLGRLSSRVHRKNIKRKGARLSTIPEAA